jgi:ATP-dependent protease ClpP protease subunit
MNVSPEQIKLAQRGILLTPAGCDGEGYENFSFLYHMARETIAEGPLDLYVCGYGGSSGAAYGMIGLIKADGHFRGFLTGLAISMHAIIWASCSTRYTLPYSAIGIHPVSLDAEGGADNLTDMDLDLLKAQNQFYNNIAITILHESSTKERQWWVEQYMTANRQLRFLSANVLSEAGMTKPLPDDWRTNRDKKPYIEVDHANGTVEIKN